MPHLNELTHDILRANIDVVILEIGNLLTGMADVCQVVLSQMYFRDADTSTFPVDTDFNDRVIAYNKYMYEPCNSFEGISFWCHRMIWADWPQYLCDGVHFNLEGNMKYSNSVGRA